AVVPVAGPHQRQPMWPAGEADVDGAGAVLVDARRRALAGLEEALGLFGSERWAIEERRQLVEDSLVGGLRQIMGDHERQPEAIVAHPGANALAGVWQPPVLDVALRELPTGGPDDLSAGEVRP